MKHHWKALLLAIPLSFFLGAAWSLWKIKGPGSKSAEKQIRILSLPGFLPHRVVERFERESGLELHITEVENELNLVNEIYANHAVYDAFQLSSYHLHFLRKANKLLRLDHQKIPGLAQVAVDFKGLPFDKSNQYSAPIQWGINGWVYKKQKTTESTRLSLREILNDKNWQGHLALLASPIELLHILKRQGYMVEEWIRTNNHEGLKNAIKALADKTNISKTEPEETLNSETVWASQMPSGKSAALLKDREHYGYFLPKEKATLWIHSLALSQSTSRAEGAYVLIEFLLSKEGSELLVNESQQAGVTVNLNKAKILPQQKPRFLRDLELNTVDLIIEHEGFQPAWQKALSAALPEVFSVNHEVHNEK